MSPLELFCATANPGKLGEFQQAARDGILIRGLPPCDCPEQGPTFEENAVSKALCYSRCPALEEHAQGAKEPLVFADDSGLVVDALGGRPGIHSARFAAPGASDESNNAFLLEQLTGVPREKRTARFVCSIALVRGAVLLETFHGAAEGLILDRPAGSGGFGYDPLFFFPRLGKGFTELSAETKWKHSHRGEAFGRMLGWLRREPDSEPRA